MYKVEKRFTVPMGHRLSKHTGLCSSFHGHNFTFLIGVMSKNLNSNDMVIDFADLKDEVNRVLSTWDHATFINECDHDFEELFEKKGTRIFTFDFDPTSEKISEILFKCLQKNLKDKYDIDLEYVTVFENENSKSTYMEQVCK